MQQVGDTPPGSGFDIAIIGMAGRFPGARTLDQFWGNLRNGVESIAFLEDDDLAASGVEPALLRNPSYVKAGAILDDVELFDAEFFGYSSCEAEVTDPQQRLFLECAWEAMEDAGYAAGVADGAVGVFGGTSMNSYLLFNLLPNRHVLDAAGQFQALLGNDKDFLASRVSYKLNLEGPSVVVQAACSTSLLAVHLACQSLLCGECDLALAGSVAVRVPQKTGYLHEPAGILSPDGHCRPFDAKAAGTVPGSGVGLVVLKRLADAQADGDYVRAVIKGSAINNDGADKIAYSVPRVAGQAKVIHAAQLMAGVGPETIGYVEAHGTGTPLGDSIEVAALTRAFRAGTRRTGYCGLGSVKSNIGYLGVAAGIAGLIKAVLTLERQELPPSLHYVAPNPAIDFAGSPFYVMATRRPWPSADGPRRAGVTAFGAGGTNAHLVLEEAPPRKPRQAAGPHLVVLSARTAGALEAATDRLVTHLRAHPGAELGDVAHTLRVGRRAFRYRRLVGATDAADAAAALERRTPARTREAVAPERPATLAFLLPGQAAVMAAGMGAGLYASEPAYRAALDDCADRLRPELGADLRDWLHGADAGVPDEPWLTQPALFAVAYSLAQLWASWGVRPEALLGYGPGEYVGACLAGIIDLQDALLLVAARGRLSRAEPRGAGRAVSAAQAEPLAELAARVALRPPQLPVVSSVTGTWLLPEEATDPRYWARQLWAPVRSGAGLPTLLAAPDRVLLEVGPGEALVRLARQEPAAAGRALVACLPRPTGASDEAWQVREALGELWLAGVAVDWAAAGPAGRRVPLPPYPFERRRHWVESPPPESTGRGSVAPAWRGPADWLYVPALVPPIRAQG